MSSYDIVVIGGGIVGASVAYHCVAHDEGSVLLVDRNDAGQASRAGAGILSDLSTGSVPAPLQSLARAAVEHYPRLLATLGELAPDVETGYSRCGMLTVARAGGERQAFDRLRPPTSTRTRAISPAEARSMFPILGPIECALWDPEAARVDGRGMTAALLEAAEKLGLERRLASVTRLRPDADRIHAIELESDDSNEGNGGNEVVECGTIAITGGAWSGELARTLGIDLPLAPQRGQILHFALTGADSAEWPIISTPGDYYLVAWPGGRVVCGATRETGAGFDPRPTAAGVREVLDRALDLAPGLADATLVEIRVGLRPLATDSLPVIGPIPGVRNVFVGAGHGPHGLTLGPYTGKRLAEWMLAGDPGKEPEDLLAFRLDRR